MPAGNIADLAFALQAAKGTPVAAAQFRTYLTGGNVAPAREVGDLEETSGSRLRSTAIVKSVRAEGSPVFYARPKMIGALLYATLGAKAVVGAGDPYTHTLTPATTQPWLTIWRMLGTTLIERFHDCKVKSLTIASQTGEALKVTAEIVGAGLGGNAASQAAVAIELAADAFLHADGRGALTFEGGAVSALSSVTCKISTGATALMGDSVTPDTVVEGMLEISFETTQTIADFALWNRLHYGTAAPAANAIPTQNVMELGAGGLAFTWSKRDDAGVDRAPARSLKIEAQRLVVTGITNVEPDTKGEPLKATVAYKVYEPAAGAAFTGTVKNAQVSYVAA